VDVISVDHLRKTYRRVVAADDLSFDVEAGEIFGILGPNGAGKTGRLGSARLRKVPRYSPRRLRPAPDLRLGS
jgi:ABC-2 type transport system ATP-binding protein